MTSQNTLALGLGLILFSFIITSILIIPFINLLYRKKLLRRKEAIGSTKKSLFDKLHDSKAGTPVGAGALIISIVTFLFLIVIPITSHMGVSIRSSFDFGTEVFIIIFTFISFGLLGLYDDWEKIFGKPKEGSLGMWFGLSRRRKMTLQIILSVIISYLLYMKLGIRILYIPLINVTLNMGIFYIPFAAFVIISFSNAFNITDGLDGLSGGLLLICLIAFAAISATSLDTPLSLFLALLIGSIISFLYFNIFPARVHLGDSGSLSFGAILAVVGLLTGGIIALVVIGGVFVIEAASSAIQIIGWKLLKKPIFPLAPIHHTFLALGWEEPKIVARAWLAGIILAVFGLWVSAI